MICGKILASGLKVILARFFRLEFRCVAALCLFYLLGGMEQWTCFFQHGQLACNASQRSRRFGIAQKPPHHERRCSYGTCGQRPCAQPGRLLGQCDEDAIPVLAGRVSFILPNSVPVEIVEPFEVWIRRRARLHEIARLLPLLCSIGL